MVADGSVGIVNGVIGGATGLAGIAAVVWCNLRSWPPAEQRAVFQPVGVATFVMIALWLGGTVMIGAETAGLFLLGLPALALGTWCQPAPAVQDRVEPRPTGRLRLGNRQRLSG